MTTITTKVGPAAAVDLNAAFVKAIASGVKTGIEDTLSTFLHPIDEVLYPLSSLVSDAVILSLPDDVVNNSELKGEALTRMNLRKEGLAAMGRAFDEGDLNTKGEMAAAFTTSLLVPGSFLKALKMSSNYVKLGKLNNIPLFHHVQDLIPAAKVSNWVDRIRLIENDKLMYVVTAEGKLVVSPHHSLVPHMRFGELSYCLFHCDLAGIKPILSGGYITISKGIINEIDNLAPGFFPQGSHLAKLTKSAFLLNGFNEVKKLRFKEVSKTKPKLMNDPYDLPIVTYQKVRGHPLAPALGAYSALHSDHEPFSFVNEAYASEAGGAFTGGAFFNASHVGSQTISFSQEKAYEQALVMEQQGEKIVFDTLKTFTTSFVETVNLIFDDQAFAMRAYEDMITGKNTLGESGLPLLRNAALVFKVIDPEKAAITSITISNTKKIVEGGIEMVNILRSEGIGALATSPDFSNAASLVVNGVTTLLNLYGSLQSRKKNAKMYRQLFEAVRTISHQLSGIDETVREYFKETSRMLMFISTQYAEGFKELFHTMHFQHEEKMQFLKDLQSFLYFDRVYLDQMYAALEEMKRTNYIQLINRADWSKEVGSSAILCKVHNKSLKLEQMETTLLKLMQTLAEVQMNGLVRANVPLSDKNGVVQRLSSSSEFLSGFQLNGEQNIHLFAKYLIHRFPALAFPQPEQLNNPAAVIDVIDAVIQLIETYQNRERGYLGLPVELGESFETLSNSMENLEQFMNALPPVIAPLWEDYEAALISFAEGFEKGLISLMYQYHKKHGCKETERRLAQDRAQIEKKQAFDFTREKPEWFKAKWRCIERFVPVYQRCVYTNDPEWIASLIPASGPFARNLSPVERNCFKGKLTFLGQFSSTKQPVPEAWKERCHYTTAPDLSLVSNWIETVRKSYNESVEQRVASIFKGQIERLNSPANFTNLFSLENSVLDQTYFFMNPNGFPLPLSQHHLNAIPKELRLAEDLGLGKFRFTWEGKDQILLKAYWSFEMEGDYLEILLFEQETTKLVYNSVFYTWFGGNATDGACSPFDFHLNRFSGLEDQEALSYYKANPDISGNYQPIANTPTGFNAIPGWEWGDRYYPTVCVPKTVSVQGAEDETVFKSWTLKKGDEKALQLALDHQSQEVKRIRRELMQEAGKRLLHPLSDESEWETVAARYTDLNLKSTVLKIALSFALNPDEVDLDTTWPGIVSGSEILKRIDAYRGQRFHPVHTLKQAIYWQKRLKEPVLEVLKTRTDPQYPFMDRKEVIEEFKEEVAPELVKRWVAETECKGPAECEKVWKSKAFQREFVNLPPSIQERYWEAYPYLEIGDGRQSSSWPLPGAQAISYPGTFNEQFYLGVYVFHYLKKCFSWFWKTGSSVKNYTWRVQETNIIPLTGGSANVSQLAIRDK